MTNTPLGRHIVFALVSKLLILIKQNKKNRAGGGESPVLMSYMYKSSAKSNPIRGHD